MSTINPRPGGSGVSHSLQEVLSLIARLPRLDGVEHVDDCPDQAKPLRWHGTSTQWDGDLEVSTARFSCSSCSLAVEVSGSVNVGPPSGIG